ncbi:MAG: hypothetical protein PHQ80_00850 [Candidatus ainarchaeum sp.]|nr:hypothetical protein [Candidatus ainarchaeum sp.]MDD5096127.1 hypothetical protein [Candidatus ainarchaeum sp.]
MADFSFGIAEFAGNMYGILQTQFGATNANVVVMALGIVAYAAVIGLFWKTLSRRNIFEIDWRKVGSGTISRWIERLKFALEYVIVFPLATFAWFVVLTLFLFFMSKTATMADMMFVSISLVAATRVCAYYDEDIAGDIAKVIPIALLGVFITQPSMFSAPVIEERLEDMVGVIGMVLPYLAMLMGLEVVLRVLFLIKRVIWPEEKTTKG